MTPLTPQENQFGKLIRERREAKNISLRKFAQQVGLSATYLSKIERGEMAAPGEEKIKIIAEHLELDEDELLALAGKVSTDLKELIMEHPKVIANFLRSTHGHSVKEIQRITEKLQNEVLSKTQKEEIDP